MKRLLACLTAVMLLSTLPSLAYTRQEEQELQLGQQVYQQLESRGKIIHESVLYDVLAPLGRRIAAVSDKMYFAPSRFILVRDDSPNAFAVPGGNVYVTDSMMGFVRNKEELAGVLCHEVSHNIHHDVFDLYAKSQRIGLWQTLAQLLLGGRVPIASYAIDFFANVENLRFSRLVERNADETGAYVCAHSGINPWGMVWLMKHFVDRPTSNPPEFLSDHPTDSHRLADLERLLNEHPNEFARFNPSFDSATPVTQVGLRDQFTPTPAPAPMPTPTLVPRIQAKAKPGCPPGWKFCPSPMPSPR